MCSPSATLAVWASSWLAGLSAPDDVLDALQAWAPMHTVGAGDPVIAGRTGLPWPDPVDTGLTALLKTIRESATGADCEIRLVLPVPGDVRGLPVGSEFAVAATEAGEGVLVGPPGGPGTGYVPSWLQEDVLGWTAFSVDVPPGPATEVGLGEAEYEMREAVREAAATLMKLHSVALESSTSDPRADVEAELAEYALHRYPESIPARARRVLDSADHVAAILTVAEDESTTAAPSASGALAREELLRPLWNSVRSARLVAVQSSVRAAVGRG